MAYLGELISIGVAFSWTATALLSEFGSKRMGNVTLNVLRMGLALLFSLVLFWWVSGSVVPQGVTLPACGWLLLSGLVGYVIGDFCLFQCYIIIGSRYGQLFMTLAPLAAALTAWLTLGQQMSATSIVAMVVTLAGIAIGVLGRGGHHRLSLRLPLRGVFYAIVAAVCQGVGLVLSKMGMDSYDMGAVLEAAETAAYPEWLVPFSANFLRCVAGLAGFSLLMRLRGSFAPLRAALLDFKGMTVATATTIFGPFVGVGFSLMAVQYTGAGVASTLMALTPIIIILPSKWIFGQPVTRRAVVGAVLSVVGVGMFFLAADARVPAEPPRSPEELRLERVCRIDTTAIPAVMRADTVAGYEQLDDLTAEAWIMVEDSLGLLISEKNADVRMVPASLTKMMTALLALELGDMGDSLQVTEADFVTRDCRVQVGDGFQLRNLIYEMMLQSDNVAACAIARHVGVDLLSFVDMMNAKAAYLGMDSTCFVNPNGLPETGGAGADEWQGENYSTARDLLRLVRYCMSDSAFARIVGTANADIPLTDRRHMPCENTNLLLADYEGCRGVKTGYTRRAGACLASTATRGGVTLHLVLLKSRTHRSRFTESAILLDYGFRVVEAFRRCHGQ